MIITGVKKNIFLVLFVLTGCAISDMHNTEVKTSALQAYPANVSIGGNIHLKFPQNHPKNLAIRNPSGTWYSIQNNDDNIFLISNEKYNAATELFLKTQVLEGIAWINGKRVKEKVFQDVGEYLIYMANNLETEPENTFHFMAKVKFIK